MADVTVHDVAAYILAELPGGMSTMKLQKLCYFAQGWSLAVLDEPLFADEFEAWARGPVCRALFAQHRTEYSVGSWPMGDPANLSPRQKLVVDAMLNNYGALTGVELSALTHKPNTPWSAARARASATEGEWCNEPLPMGELKLHFKATLGR